MSTEDIRPDLEDQQEGTRLVPAVPEKFHEGKDELNFAEFPLGTIAERIDPSQKTLVYEDKIYDTSKGETISRKLTITGSDAYGLPTATDDEVLLGLIQLSKLQRFSSSTVYFSRYQLVKLLGWSVDGRSYARIEQALKRWLGVSLFYENAWRDKTTNSWQNEGFHILDNVKIDQGENEQSRPKPNPNQGTFEFAASSFNWNKVVYRSFQQGNLKALDFAFVMQLRSSITRRLYRFLDKRFYNARNLEFDLKTLAFEHVGLSRNTPTGDLKRKLRIGIKELEVTGFLKVLPETERFGKVKAGVWRVRFEKAIPGEREVAAEQGTSPVQRPTPSLSPLEQKLVDCGISAEKATKLVAKHPPQLIEEKIEVFRSFVAANSPKVSQNPAGFLIRSIEGRFETPKNFETEAKRKAKEEAKKKREEERKAREQRRLDREAAKEKARQEAIAGYWESLSDGARKIAEAEALSKLDRFQADLIQRGGPLGGAAKQAALDNYALSALSQG